MAVAIWVDTWDVLNAVPQAQNFRLRANGQTLYSGRAYPRPGQNTVEVYYNDVVADAVRINRPRFALDNKITLDANPVKVYIDGYANGSWSEVTNTDFYYDWTYDTARASNAPAGPLALPVNGRMCDGMAFTFSVYKQAAVYPLDLNMGASHLMDLTPTAVSDEVYPYSGTLLYNVANILSYAPQTDRVVVLGVEYTIVPACHRFALYYLNEIGGWDFLLIEGNHRIVDGVTRWNREQVFNNTPGYGDRGKVTYAEEIVRRYTLYTGNLTDDESSRMHHLLNSPDVWLLDLESGDYIPVTLTNTETPYKTFVSEGRTFYVYEINCETANYMERR